ncbi:MAG: hypothetical protein M1272_01170 [Firmicutes bacterium]|nr:hypothetical protein [Bacillota bacterium]
MIEPAVRPASGASRRKPFWLFGLFVLGSLLGLAHQPIEHTFYVAARDADIAATEVRLSGWPTLQNAHFRVYYPPGQAREASWVLTSATQALPYEEQNLTEVPQHRLTIVVYSTQAAMNASVGLPADANNIGYDYNGVMDILSPEAWIGTDAEAKKAFLTQGPVPHELGHALLNLKANANYPNWFNEGVAQYEDMKVTGYQWITPTNSLTGPLYTMSQLDHSFYELPNQSLAYRQGLALVSYLETVHGEKAFQAFLGQLTRGESFSTALRHVYHLSSTEALFSAWQETETGR